MSARNKDKDDLFEYLLRLGDDRLVLGQRLSEWAGRGPILEVDIALANLSLDYCGQAKFLLDLAGQVENQGRDADRLAFGRDVTDFRNAALVEQPNGDFAHTIVRQLLFSAYSLLLWQELERSSEERLAGVASKSVKEERYHLRFARDWTLRLGDGTDQSRDRIQEALEDLWMFSAELFEPDDVDRRLVGRSMAPDLTILQKTFHELIDRTLREATLAPPDSQRFMFRGSRHGRHTEHLGHLLSEMQFLQRAYPDMEW